MPNVNNPRGFTFRRNLDGKGCQMVSMPMKESTAIAKGDAVAIDTSVGYIYVALSSSASIYGIAAESRTTGAGENDEILIIPALPHYIFSGQTSGTAAITQRGTAVDIEGTTGIMEINENATTEKVIQIFDLFDGKYGGEINAWGANAELEFIIARSQFTGFAAEL